MTELTERPRVLGLAIGRSRETQADYEAHVQRKLELGDCSCDMCRLAKEQKVGAGVLEITSKKLEIVSRELERVDDEISLVVNEYGYKFYDGQMVRKHLMVLPIEHYARLSDLPRRTKKAYDHILPLIMDVVDMSFTRSPGSKGSSQKGHLHTHAMIFDETVEELHFNRSDGTVIRRSGSTELEHL